MHIKLVIECMQTTVIVSLILRQYLIEKAKSHIKNMWLLNIYLRLGLKSVVIVFMGLIVESVRAISQCYLMTQCR